MNKKFVYQVGNNKKVIQNQMRGEVDYQWWIGKNLEERDCGLFQGTLPILALINWS